MSETRVIRGRWWLADKSSDDGVPGTLTLSDDEFRLDLEDTLLTDPELKAKVLDYRAPGPVARILGETTDRDEVTLENCDLAGRRDHAVRDRGTRYSDSYWPRVVCIGAWFHADEPLAFDTALVRLTSLHPWTAVSGFSRKSELSALPGRRSRVTYRPPPDYRATFADGTRLTLSFPLKKEMEGLYTSELRLVQDTRFAFEFPEPREVKGVQTLVFTLRNFLTLAVGEGVKVTQLVGYRKPLPTDELPIGRQAEILYRHLENPRARELPNHHGMVFLLPDMGERFEEHMVRWFDHAPELGRVLDLYFSTLHAEFVYLETRFMNFAQAIEGYHRRRLDRLAYDKETFKTYRETILDGLSGSIRSLAKKALHRADELSLKDRIKDVLKELGDPATSIVAAGKMTPNDFAERAAGIRNIYAHNLRSEEPEHLELVMFTYQLKALVEACFLHEIGFEPGAIDRMLREARHYNLIEQVRERREIRGPGRAA